MKKIKILLPILVLPTIGIPTVLTSCSDKEYNTKVHLRAFSDPFSSVGVDDSDFWLCAEPSYTSIKETRELKDAGDLQSLYGENGFNQAVLVCKKGLLDSDPKYLNEIKGYLEGNLNYVSDITKRQEIITNIRDPNNQFDSSRASTFPEGTSTQAMVRCNPKYVEYTTDILSYKSFITKAHEIDSNVEIAADAFYNGFPASSETTEEKQYTIYCPDGAPAVGIANIIANKGTKTIIKICDPTTIMARTTRYKPDLAVLPSNLATKIYNQYGNEYVFLSTVTWGNLYFLSSKHDVLITKDNLKDILYGKTLGVQQLAAAPGLALKIVFKDNNINYEQ